MSEKIFACFLRLYPSRFREKYTEEAIQLYSDLYRHEAGLLRKTGLWIGLLTDLALGLPQAYRNTYVSTAASPVAQVVQGMPTFSVLEQEPIRPGLFFFGSFLSLALFGVLFFVLNHPDVSRARSVSSASTSPIEAVLERLNQPTSSGQSGNESLQTDDSALDEGRNEEARKVNSLATHQGGAETQTAINPNERHQVIQLAVESPDAHYPNQQRLKIAQEAMQQNELRGASNAAVEGTVSSARPILYLQPTTRKTPATITRNSDSIPSGSGASAVAISPYRATAKQQNCIFDKIKVMPHNIGYFKLDSFPDSAICGASTHEAMIQLNETSAIIVDLRENRGGDPEMAEEIAAWLFAHPAAWYNTGARSAAQSMTHSPVQSSRLGNKPVYILTSSQTADGAEQFAYNLKMLKRATVIGERTHGKPDWEGTGVAPDVEVKTSDALRIAEESARARIARK